MLFAFVSFGIYFILDRSFKILKRLLNRTNQTDQFASNVCVHFKAAPSDHQIPIRILHSPRSNENITENLVG